MTRGHRTAHIVVTCAAAVVIALVLAAGWIAHRSRPDTAPADLPPAPSPTPTLPSARLPSPLPNPIATRTTPRPAAPPGTTP